MNKLAYIRTTVSDAMRIEKYIKSVEKNAESARRRMAEKKGTAGSAKIPPVKYQLVLTDQDITSPENSE